MSKREEITPSDSEIRKIKIWKGWGLRGMKFLDKNNNVILATGDFTAEGT